MKIKIHKRNIINIDFCCPILFSLVAEGQLIANDFLTTKICYAQNPAFYLKLKHDTVQMKYCFSCGEKTVIEETKDES